MFVGKDVISSMLIIQNTKMLVLYATTEEDEWARVKVESHAQLCLEMKATPESANFMDEEGHIGANLPEIFTHLLSNK